MKIKKFTIYEKKIHNVIKHAANHFKHGWNNENNSNRTRCPLLPLLQIVAVERERENCRERNGREGEMESGTQLN